MALRKAINERAQRTLRLELRDNTEAGEHSVELSFSSENPVSRGWYTEILSHSPECIRVGERQQHMPLLFNHNPNDLLGVVERAWLGEDRRQHAVVRFAQDERGKWAEQMVRDGILTNVSFQYQIYDYREETKDVFRAIDWEVFEISLVTVPADESVGVNRSDPGKVAPEPKSDESAREAQKEETKMTEKSSDDILREERARVAEIDALCRQHDMDANWRNQMINEGASVDMVRSAILKKIAAERSARPASPVADMSKKERGQYSLMRAIKLMSSGRSVDGLEKEVSDQLARSQGLSETSGLYIPSAVGSRAWTGGDNLVGTQHMAEEFVSYLRERSVLANLGARVLSGLVGNVEIPAMEGGATVYWGKDKDITQSDATFGSVELTMKQAGALMTIPRSLLIQSTPAAEQIIRDDLFNALAEAVDKAAIAGTGTDQPTGLLSTSGIGEIALGTNGGLVTWDTIIDMATKVREAKVLAGSFAYLVNPTTLGFLQKMKDTTDRPLWHQSIIEGRPNLLNGYRVVDSTLVPSDLSKGTASKKCSALIFGAWNELLMGEWSAVEITLNPYGSAFASGGTQIRAIQNIDTVVRRPAAFCVVKDFDPTAAAAAAAGSGS